MRSSLLLSSVLVFALGCESSVPPNTQPLEAAPAALPAPEGSVSGRILESLSASSYSYLRLKTRAGEQWVAVPNTELPVGTEVILVNPHEMKDFESKTLSRRFESILFGTLHGLEPREKAPTSVPSAPKAVQLAEGSRSIATVHAEREALEGQPVQVTGEVVKFTPGILDRNWLHLRDGSGSEVDKTHDLTVTTSETVKVGERVTATGIVRVGKDFGAGYFYEVLVEEARLEKQ